VATPRPRARLRVWQLWRSRFTRDVSALFLAQVAILLSAVVQGVLVARWLGPRRLGVSALIVAYPGLVYAVLDAQSSDASVKYLGEFAASSDTARALAMCKLGHLVDAATSSAAFVAVILTASWASAHVVHDTTTAGLLVLYAGALVIRSPSDTSSAMLTTLGRFGSLGWLQALSSVGRSAIVLILVGRGWGVPGVIWGTAIALLFDGVAKAVVAHRAASRAWGAAWSTASLAPLKGRGREIGTFIAYSDVGTLVALVVKQADSLILGYFRGATEVGYYGIARSFSGLVGYLVDPLQQAVFPRFARLWDDLDQLARTARRYGTRIGISALVAVLATIPLVPLAIRLTTGPSYRPAAGATQVLLVSSAVWLGCFWLRPLYLSLGEVRLWVLVNSASTVLALIGFLTLTPHWGFRAMAVVVSATTVAMHVGSATLLARRHRGLLRVQRASA
jgi:O-antigen/teichoic acid export membrane protein